MQREIRRAMEKKDTERETERYKERKEERGKCKEREGGGTGRDRKRQKEL